VIYAPGDHGTFTAQITSGLRYDDVTPVAPVVTGDANWNFTGWLPVPSATVTGDATYVAQWSQMSTPSPSPSPTPTPSSTATPTPTPSSTATPTPTLVPSPSLSPTGTPGTRIPPSVDRWAVVNLVLSILGAVLVVVVFVRAMLLKKKDDKNRAGDAADEKFVQRRTVWLITVLVLAIVGVVVFLLTEDIRLSMGWVDKWTIVNAIILIVEIIATMFVFHNKKTGTNKTGKKSAKNVST
jgi:uncharacterized membrane protein YhaH (DUF805 family)